jgi:hypothetical protein
VWTRSPRFAGLAERVHTSWADASTPVPSRIDFENGVRLAEDAFEAAAIREARGAGPAEAPAFATYDLDAAGLHRRVLTLDDGSEAVLGIASKLGGPVALYIRRTGESWRLADEDSGYLLRLADGTSWVARHPGSGRIVAQDAGSMTIEAGFARSRHEELTPSRMILLRSLNLTVLRSQTIGDLFKKIVVRRLISGREPLPVSLRRTIAWSSGGIRIEDRLVAAPAIGRRLEGAELLRCRRVIANHMASSRYFQPAELTLRRPWIEPLPFDASVETKLSMTLETRPR